jgi:hypothetical protein
MSIGGFPSFVEEMKVKFQPINPPKQHFQSISFHTGVGTAI